MGNCCAVPSDLSEKKKGKNKPNPFSIDYGATQKTGNGGYKSYVLENPTGHEIEQTYKLGDELGRGEFGVTYVCTDKASGEVFACKSISKKKLRTRVDIEDVRREVEIMKHLPKHTNIVSLKDTYEDDTAVHLVMELCEGGELFDRIVARGHYTERAAAAVTRTIVEIIQKKEERENTEESSGSETMEQSLDLLPSALLATIMTKLDVPSICSVASTCKTFNSCTSQILSFLPNFYLLDIAPSIELLRPLLPPNNPYLRTLKVDCTRLDDSSIDYLLRPSLHDLSLHNCADFSGKLLSEVGERCKDLRSLYLSSVADKRWRSICVSDLEQLLSGCTQLETLILMFDVSVFLRHNFARVWALASSKLTCLEIGYISSVMVTELLSPTVGPQHWPNQIQPPVLPSIQKLWLAVDYITDTMIGTISKNLASLTHLDLRDAPIIEPSVTFDLTNSGLQSINPQGKLKHLSLVRSQEFVATYFKRVNDLGVLLMADRCSNMESICLGGFCRVTDTGFKTILHSCASLYKFRVSHGSQLTDLVFHDMYATSLSLTHVSLRWCNLLTNLAFLRLASNRDLSVLDLRDCRNLGDAALRAIGTLPKLKTLLLDGSDISGAGLSYLKERVISSLVSLSVRGCKRLTDKCISFLFDGSCSKELRELDLSNLPNLSDATVLLLAKSRVQVVELRMRQCPLIGDTSVMALASMQVDDDRWHGSSLRLLDLFNCGGITPLSFRWLKKPYFPRLRWLGVTGSVNRDLIDALARSRPFLHVSFRGEELGTDQWDNSDDMYMHDYEEVDELEQWLLDDDNETDDEDMEDAEYNVEE